MSGDFWLILVQTGSFWKSIAPPLPFLLGILGAAGALCWLMRRRPVRLDTLAGNERGAAVILDLALVAPIFVTIMVAFLQWAILLNDTIVVHYAAFAAARSARVYLCPTIPFSANQGIAQAFGLAPCSGGPNNPENAARFALIPASPFNDQYRCEGSCQAPEDAMKALAHGMQIDNQTGAWLQQARYAFDPANVKVDVSIQLLAYLARVGSNVREMPVTAIVQFRHVLMFPMDKVFGDGYRSDGVGYRTIVAQMTLI
jgi:hypothetical protein